MKRNVLITCMVLMLVVLASISASATLLPYGDMETPIPEGSVYAFNGLVYEVVPDANDSENHLLKFDTSARGFGCFSTKYQNAPLNFTPNTSYDISFDLTFDEASTPSSYVTVYLYSNNTAKQTVLTNFNMTIAQGTVTKTISLHHSSINVDDPTYEFVIRFDQAGCIGYLDNVVFEPVAKNKMTTDKKSFLPGETINIHYEGTGNNDWIGIYDKGVLPSGSGSSPAHEWKYAFADGAGTITLTAPTTTGVYTLYLCQNNGYTVIESLDINVADGQSFMIDKETYLAGEDVVSSCANIQNTSSWIGIYAADKAPGQGDSLVWTYLNKGDGDYILKAPSSVGKYRIYMLGDSGYSNILGYYDFEVTKTSGGRPIAPVSMTYERAADAKPGFADGKVTVQGDPDALSDAVLLYWGDENGALADYGFLGYASRSNQKYIYNITKNNVIPEGATHLVAYGCNGNINSVLNRGHILSTDYISIPIDAEPHALGNLLYEFEVISDLHVQSSENTSISRPWGQTNMDRTEMALKDINKHFPGSAGIMIVGDAVNEGYASQYDELDKLMLQNVSGFERYYTVGNHEFYYNGNDGFEDNWKRFRDYTGFPDGRYFYYMIKGGDYFIFLGEESRGTDTAHGVFSPQQRAWLQNVLNLAAQSESNAFIFMHQGIDDTVSGTFVSRGQGWSGINDDAEMKAVIDSYSRSYLFSGHTHWCLNSYGPFLYGGEDGASYFNTASAGYLWSDANVAVPGVEGLHVEVYDNGVFVRGRDYEFQKWVPNVQTFIPTVKENENRALSLGSVTVKAASDGLGEGLRFAAFIDEALAADAESYGFLVAPYDTFVENGYDEEELVFDGDLTVSAGEAVLGTTPNGLPFICAAAYDGTKEVTYAESTGDGTEVLYMSGDASGKYFTAVLRGIDKKTSLSGDKNNSYKVQFVIRPYVKVDGKYTYGACSLDSAYSVAKRMLACRDTLTEEETNYLTELLQD